LSQNTNRKVRGRDDLRSKINRLAAQNRAERIDRGIGRGWIVGSHRRPIHVIERYLFVDDQTVRRATADAAVLDNQLFRRDINATDSDGRASVRGRQTRHRLEVKQVRCRLRRGRKATKNNKNNENRKSNERFHSSI